MNVIDFRTRRPLVTTAPTPKPKPVLADYRQPQAVVVMDGRCLRAKPPLPTLREAVVAAERIMEGPL